MTSSAPAPFGQIRTASAPSTAKVITYSPAYTLVPTYDCFNRCTYCNFRTDLGQSPWLTLEDARQRLIQARDRGTIEVLVLSGEVAPNHPLRPQWVAHIHRLCELALTLGLLPHTNVGPLSRTEMALLKTVNVSMGLMVEQTTPVLLQGVHRHAPSKHPQLRLRQLAQAGELAIPFTTGLLLGIGEQPADWESALEAIAACNRRYGHIQEVILQPHSPGQRQLVAGSPVSPQGLVQAVTLARQILPPAVAVQIPPNLVDDGTLQTCLAAGATDLGGLSPIDEVNPDYAHPTPANLAQRIAPRWRLQPRLPLYPAYDSWLSPALGEQVRPWRQRLADSLQAGE